MQSYYALIMAGGGGTRLWPLSRKNRPKQLLKLLGERSMFELAVDRLLPLFAPEQILVVASAAYAGPLRAQRPQLPAENFIVEPEPRNTAPAIGLAAAHLHRRDPEAVMACLTADHFIGQEALFRDLLQAAEKVARQDYLVTLGIHPTFASTGYGYIQRGGALKEPGLPQAGPFQAFHAERFKEKPGLAEAEAMLADGLHAWNSGMFVWRVERLLQEYARQMPELYQALVEIEATPEALGRVWGQTPKTSIDYGIMEGAAKAGAVAVIPAEGLNWSDIGSWDALIDLLPPDAAGNVVVGGEHLGLETTGTLIHASGPCRLVATIGVSNLVIIATDDAVFVCPRERAQEVRSVVEALKGRPDYL